MITMLLAQGDDYFHFTWPDVAFWAVIVAGVVAYFWVISR
jgi:hypothetical protein